MRQLKRLWLSVIEKGEHIAIWADNKPEWVLTQFATGKMGAVLVTVNTSYQAAELEYLLNQSDTTTLILAENFKGTSYVDIVNEVAPELKNSEPGQLNSDKVPKLKRVIVLGKNKLQAATHGMSYCKKQKMFQMKIYEKEKNHFITMTLSTCNTLQVQPVFLKV